jgi:molybdenum cofactor cytidylyltransferase
MLAGLVLAAGESSRMGRDKALLDYRGRTFLEHILATLLEAGLDRVTVVLGHHAEEIQRAVRLDGATVIVNAEYRRGQTSSCQAGLRSLESEGVDAVVLCLVDHPAISTEVVGQIIEAYRSSNAPVVIPTYQGRRGHPVLIARPLFAELLALGASEGANSVVRKYRDLTRIVETDDPGVLIDVDDEQTYFKLVNETLPRELPPSR